MPAPSFDLLADVGGTHVRFAWREPGGPTCDTATFRVADFPDFESASHTYLEATRPGRAPGGIAVCAAGPAHAGRIALTNADWIIDREALAAVPGVTRTAVVNDFTALAWALPLLGPADLVHHGRGKPDPGGAYAVIGPGTGLGVSGLVPAPGGGHAAVSGEGGHADLAPGSARESDVLEHLANEFGHVSAERVLSGGGLANLYRAVGALDGGDPQRGIDPRRIARTALDGSDPVAVEALTLFTAWLGAAAGNVALVLGASAGVYLAGGIVPAWGEAFDLATFRNRFEAKGRLGPYLRAIPTFTITVEHPAMRGLGALLDATD